MNRRIDFNPEQFRRFEFGGGPIWVPLGNQICDSIDIWVENLCVIGNKGINYGEMFDFDGLGTCPPEGDVKILGTAKISFVDVVYFGILVDLYRVLESDIKFFLDECGVPVRVSREWSRNGAVNEPSQYLFDGVVGWPYGAGVFTVHACGRCYFEFRTEDLVGV